MITVHKYPIQFLDKQEVFMPKGAKVLSFHSQYEQPCIWALVNTNEPVGPRSFCMVGTGHPLVRDPSELKFVGTARLLDDKLVYHLFEVL